MDYYETHQEGSVGPQVERRSASLGELVKALAKAQLSFETVKKDKKNPYFNSRYADLGMALSATQKALADNGIVVIQEAVVENGKAGVVSTICHASGEWKESTLLLPVTKQDAQGVGSAITYARRYAYMAIVGVAPEDDDANAAVEQASAHEQAYENRVSAKGRIKQFQVNAFLNMCKEHGKTVPQIEAYLKTQFGAVQAEDLMVEQFNTAIKWASKNGDPDDLTDTLKASVKAVKGKGKKDELADTQITEEESELSWVKL